MSDFLSEGFLLCSRTVRCRFYIRNYALRNQTLEQPNFLATLDGVGDKKRKSKKCHKTCPEGSDFDENLCFRRCFSRRIFLRGSQPDSPDPDGQKTRFLKTSPWIGPEISYFGPLNGPKVRDFLGLATPQNFLSKTSTIAMQVIWAAAGGRAGVRAAGGRGL